MPATTTPTRARRGKTAATAVSHRLVIKAQMPDGILPRSVYSLVAKKYQPWGANDRYPQDMILAINGSSTGATCVDTKAKYIKGNGFADTNFYQAKVNRQGLQVDALLALHANDLAALWGFCCLININGNGLPCEVQHTPFAQWRPARPDGDGVVRWDYIITKPAEAGRGGVANTKAKVYRRYNPNEKPAERWARIVAQCAEEKIPVSEYPGELFVYFHKKSGALNHPRPLHDAVLRDMLTEATLKVSRHTDARNGYSAQAVITEYGTATPGPDKLKADQDKYSEMVGEEGVRLVVQYAADKNSKPDIDTLAVNDTAKRYRDDEGALKANIRGVFLLPDILYGEATAGKLGPSQEMEDAVNYASRLVVNEDQRALEMAYKSIFGNFQPIPTPAPDGSIVVQAPGKFNITGNYTIQNLTLHDANTEEAEPSEQDKRLAKLAALPVLLANKVLDSMTGDEIRALIGLPPTAKAGVVATTTAAATNWFRQALGLGPGKEKREAIEAAQALLAAYRATELNPQA